MANDPAQYGAAPIKGNYTGDAYMHLWCAGALSAVVGNDDAFGDWNNDIQAALRYLLACEVRRARAALAAETAEAATQAARA